MTEEELMFCYWYEELTGENVVEELCERMEITVDYFMEEFVV